MNRFEKIVIAAALGLALAACGSGDSSKPDVAARAGAAAENLKESAKSMGDKAKSLSDEAAKSAAAAGDKAKEMADSAVASGQDAARAMGDKASALGESMKPDPNGCLSLVGQAQFQKAMPVCMTALGADPDNKALQDAVAKAKAGAANTREAAGDAAAAAKNMLGGQ